MNKMQNLQQHARRFLAHSSSKTRFYCSYRNGTILSPASTHTRNPSLVRGIVEKHLESKEFRKGLEVSDWMIEQKICNLIPEDFTTRFHLIENVSGFEKAEKFFESIPKNQRGESIYTALLNSYAESGKQNLDKAQSTFEKMRELGLLLKPSPYNSMTSLYRSVGDREKVDEILREMEENKVQLDSLSVNNALRVYASVSDVATMEKFLTNWESRSTIQWFTTLDMAKAYLKNGSKGKAREMLRRTEKWKNPKSYEELMRLYVEAGGKEDVYRIFDLYKKTKEGSNEGFRDLIGYLLKLNDIKGAEEIFSKWERSGLEFDIRIPSMLASGYREREMMEKADKLMNKIMKNKVLVRKITPLLEEWGKNENQVKPSELRDLIKDLSDSNQYSKALEASSWMVEKRRFNLFPEDYAARLHLIENVLSLEEAEKFFESDIPENMKDYSVYSTLLTLYTRSDKTFFKAEAIFEKMGELGFLSKRLPFNSMISLYSQLGIRSEVENLVLKMEEKKIEPDSVTMNNLLKVYADETDIKTMEECKKEWELDGKKTKT